MLYLGVGWIKEESEVYSLFDKDDGEESLSLNATECFIPRYPDVLPREPVAFVVNGTLINCGESPLFLQHEDKRITMTNF